MQQAQRSQLWNWYTAAMIFVLLAASFLFFRNIAFGLPDYLYGDEGAMWITASQVASGEERTYQLYYPPGFVYTYAGEINFLELITPGAVAREITLFSARVTSAAFGLLTLAMVFAIGRRLRSPLAGLLATAFVALLPTHIEHVHQLKPDIVANALSIFTLLTAIIALERSDRWLAVSLVAAFAAFLTKYTSLTTLGVPFLAAVVKYWKQPYKLLTVGGATLLAMVVGLGLIHWRIDLVKAIQDLPKSAATLYEKDSVLELVSVRSTLGLFVKGSGLPTVIIGLILLPIVITFHQRWTASLVQKLVVIVGFGAAVFAPLSFFPAVFTRYLMASFVAMGILWGLALAWLLPRRFAPLVLIAAIGLLLPKGSETWELVEWFGQEDTIALGTDWLRENTPQGARIAADGEANRFYLNRYAGYTGPLVYNITDLPVHETGMVDLQNQGIEYIVASTVASRDYYNEIVNSDNPDGPTVVAEIPSPTGTRGPGLLIIAVPPYQQHVRYLWLGDAIPAGEYTMYPIAFRGYDLPRTELQPGFVLEFVLYWMSVVDTTTDYVVEARLVDPDTGDIVAQHESQPDSGHHPTSAWEGDMQFFRDKHLFVLPSDLQPGTYSLRIALADPNHGGRLPVNDVDGTPLGDSFSLGEITIAR
jgi:hypothetical protein